MELRGPAENSDAPAQPEARTHATTRGEPSRNRPGITPLEMFRFEHQKARFAYWVAGSSMAFALMVIVFVSNSVGRTERIFVLDGGGNVHYGPLVSMATSQELLQTVTVLATQTALSRSSVGFDIPEFLNPLFLPIARRTIETDLDEQQADLRTRSIQQKPVINEITGPISEGFGKRMEVSGKLIRSGVYLGRSIYEEADFKLTLTFKRNPNIGAVACYPWVVGGLELTVSAAE